MSIPELLVNDGFITQRNREKIEDLSNQTGLSYIKIALNFGYISRKNYERSLINAGYNYQPVRDLAYDPAVLSKIDLKFADQHVGLPLRIENNRVVTVMADPSNQLFIDFIRFTYDCEPEIIIASDLEVVWLSHKLLGEKYVKSSVFELLNRDPNSSAFVTFSSWQLAALFILLGVVVVGLVVNFKFTSITINVIISTFFLVAILFKLFLALVGSRFELHQAVTRDDLKELIEEELPIYSILLPVYKEDKLIKKADMEFAVDRLSARKARHKTAYRRR